MSWFIEVENLRKKGKLPNTMKVSVKELINLKDRLEIAETTVSTLQQERQQQTVPPSSSMRKTQDTPLTEDPALVAGKDQIVQNLQAALNDKELTVNKLKEELALNQERLLTFAAQLENFPSEKSQIPSSSEGLEEDNYKLMTHVSQLEMMVTEKTEALNRANDMLQELQKNKISLEEYISNLKTEVVNKDIYEAAQKQIQEQSQRIQALTGDYSNLSNKLNAMQNQLAAKDRELKMAAPTMVMTPSLAKPVATSTTISSASNVSPQSVTPAAPLSSSYDSYYSQEAINQDTARVVCPHCGSQKISVVDDKTQVISYVPSPVYKKKNLCSQCGFEF